MQRTNALVQKLTTSRAKKDQTEHGATGPTGGGRAPRCRAGSAVGASSPLRNGAASHRTYRSQNRVRKGSRPGPDGAPTPGPPSRSPAARALPAHSRSSCQQTCHHRPSPPRPAPPARSPTSGATVCVRLHCHHEQQGEDQVVRGAEAGDLRCPVGRRSGGAVGPDGVGSGGRATAQPLSLWLHRDATTTASLTAKRSRRPPGPAIQARTAPPERRPTGQRRSPASAPRTTWSSPCCS